MGEGKQLKLLLSEKGITVKQLAEQIKVPPTTLYSAISRDAPINRKLYGPIAKCLGMDAFELLCELNIDKMDTGDNYIPDTALVNEVSVDSINLLRRISISTASHIETLIENYLELNALGQQEAEKRIEELTHIDKYTEE